MQYPGVLRNSVWDVQVLIKKQVEIPRSLCLAFWSWNFRGASFFLTQFCGIFGDEAFFCPEFPRVK